MRSLTASTPAEVHAEDPCKVRNRANYARLEQISADLLAEAIGIFKTMTPHQAREFRLRCLRWFGGELREGDEWGDKSGKVIASFASERELVMAYLRANVVEDNWELVRFDEGPRFTDKGVRENVFVPAKADSPNDRWPEEKFALWQFINSNVSDANRYLVTLLNPEDRLVEQEAKKPRVVA